MLITAARLGDTAPTITTSGISIATGFTLIEFTGYRVGNVINLRAYISRSGADIADTTGNIADTQICTMPSGWRPTAGTIIGFWGSGVEGGEVIMATDGVCQLRTASDDINTGANIRLHFTFIVD